MRAIVSVWLIYINMVDIGGRDVALCRDTESHGCGAGSKFVRWARAGDVILDVCRSMRWWVMSTRYWAGRTRCSVGRPLVVWQRWMPVRVWLVPGIGWAEPGGR